MSLCLFLPCHMYSWCLLFVLFKTCSCFYFRHSSSVLATKVHTCYCFFHSCEFKWVCMLTLQAPFFPLYLGGIVSLTVPHYPYTPLFVCLPVLEFCREGALLLKVFLSRGESKNWREIPFVGRILGHFLFSSFSSLYALGRGDSWPFDLLALFLVSLIYIV